jgi:hypothetical protein
MSSNYTERLLIAARKLVQSGLAIFEAKPNKAPATKRGFKDATRDAEQVKNWRPNATIGLPTGAVNDLTIIDLDVDAAKGLDARNWLREQEEKHGKLPEHPIVSTPRGGEHHYFNPRGAKYLCSASKLAPGVDIRGECGYVIAPDSRTPTGQYTWIVAPWDVPPNGWPRS